MEQSTATEAALGPATPTSATPAALGKGSALALALLGTSGIVDNVLKLLSGGVEPTMIGLACSGQSHMGGPQ